MEYKYDYDVVLSFAGEDREYVGKVADMLYALGIRVFYDKYEQVELWGKNLYVHLDEIYQKRSQYCVIFISKYYKEKLWTSHERESAQTRAFQQNQEYILPVRLDDTEIPGIRLTTGYIRGDSIEPEELALLVAKKVNTEIDVNLMIKYLKVNLPDDYEIYIKGTDLVFKSDSFDYYGEFPIRLLLEMYKMDMLDYMFLMPGIVPS
ncbi:toll/interleukin-1 receptor domain-containing protein [Sporomusa acidovorans]|uniref:TIR domain-containing protein n=1 Tax=Sporomusa acidovorans (strain ATCC 49682 / DSM 3132 / Mol) TaxID=1123286 RepID=A0ABZ3IYP4_SPOA4|nr:TIR domain-containing protein [Sporomusa acidovorans]OZC17724.1 hypothetical protein SPACI_37280 [Sporomusa acidovorans DSM 3132]SDE13152.1 TIR domain-containing protein [Sporomusa acidovorans]